MKKFVYPAVIYHDNEAGVYVMAIEELCLYVEGNSVEEVHANMNAALNYYITTAIAFNYPIPEAENFNIVMARNPKNIVLLVDTSIDEKKIKKLAE